MLLLATFVTIINNSNYSLLKKSIFNKNLFTIHKNDSYQTYFFTTKIDETESIEALSTTLFEKCIGKKLNDINICPDSDIYYNVEYLIIKYLPATEASYIVFFRVNKKLIIKWNRLLLKCNEAESKNVSDYEIKSLEFDLKRVEFDFFSKLLLFADEKSKNDAEKVKNVAKEVMNAAKEAKNDAKEAKNTAEKSFSNELVKILENVEKKIDDSAKDSKETANKLEKKIDDSAKDSKKTANKIENMEKKIDDSAKDSAKKIDNIEKKVDDSARDSKEVEKKIENSLKDEFWYFEEDLSKWATELFKKVDTIKFADDESNENVAILEMKNRCIFAPANVKNYFVRKSVFKTFEKALKTIFGGPWFRYFFLFNIVSAFIIGNSGLGKSSFLLIIAMLGLKTGRILHHLDLKRERAYKYKVTSDGKVEVFGVNLSSFDSHTLTMNDLLLVDPGKAGEYKLKLFDCPTITVCSPNSAHYKEYDKHAAAKFYVGMWSREEIEQIGQYHIPVISKEIMKERIPTVGPVLGLLTYNQVEYRDYLENIFGPVLENSTHEDIFGITGIPNDSDSKKAMIVSALYCVKPVAENGCYELEPISEYITSKLVSRFSTKILDIINNSTADISLSIGYLFEYLFFNILTCHSSDPVDSFKHKCSGFYFSIKPESVKKDIKIFVLSFISPVTKYSELYADSFEDFKTKVFKYKNESGNFIIRGSNGLPMVDLCTIVDKKIIFWQTTTAALHKFASRGVVCAKYVIDNPEAFFGFTSPRDDLHFSGVDKKILKGNYSEFNLDEIKYLYNSILQLNVKVKNLNDKLNDIKKNSASSKQIAEIKLKADIEDNKKFIKSQDNELLNLIYKYLNNNKKLFFVN